MFLRQAFAQHVDARPVASARLDIASTEMRGLSLIAGTNQAVSGSRGWTATAKPKDEGGTYTISRQLAEPSSLRKTPL